MKRNVFSVCLILILIFALPLSAYAQGYYIQDHANLLTPEEIVQLEELAKEMTETYGIDAVIVTVDSLGSVSAQTYADDYYDENGYRIDGLILLLAMEEREWYISTSGIAIEAFTDFGIECMGDNMLNSLSSGKYYKAFWTFLTDIPYYMDNYLQGEPVDVDTVGGVNFIIALFVGLIVAAVAILVMRAGMNTKRPQHSAGNYLKEGSYDLKTRQDVFLYSQVSKSPRQQSSSGSGGGSRTHTSSSGRTHGGGGGKF